MPDKIFASTVFTGSEILKDRLITVENGSVASVEPAVHIPSIRNVPCIAAGFADIHINGGEKCHFTEHTEAGAIEDVNDSCLACGTAYSMPALITSPLEKIFKSIDVFKEYRAKHPVSGILGIHLEGPFISPAKRGAHLTEYIKKPSDAELAEIISYGKDVVRMITIAPEVFTAKQIEMLLASGITVSAGHSNATYREAKRAFDMGVNLVTHLYNAMSALGHREPGLVGATFDTPSVYAPVILDGLHCDFAAARIAYKMKREKLFLISDALFVNRKVKQFQWGRFDAYLENDQYVNSEGNLAGAAISIGEAIRNAVNEVGIPLQEAVEMATVRPAKALGLDSVMGRIEAGYPAVFTVFDESLESFEVLKLH